MTVVIASVEHRFFLLALPRHVKHLTSGPQHRVQTGRARPRAALASRGGEVAGTGSRASQDGLKPRSRLGAAAASSCSPNPADGSKLSGSARYFRTMPRSTAAGLVLIWARPASSTLDHVEHLLGDLGRQRFDLCGDVPPLPFGQLRRVGEFRPLVVRRFLARWPAVPRSRPTPLSRGRWPSLRFSS